MLKRPGFSFGAFGGKLGAGLAGAGLLVIGLAWNGAAGQPAGDLRMQFPYLLSGGLIGLSLVILGAALLVVQSAREDRALLEAKLDLLAEAFLEGQGRAPAQAPSDLSGLVVAGTASYHLPSCRLVEGRESANYLTPVEATERGLKPCRVCRPQSVEVVAS